MLYVLKLLFLLINVDQKTVLNLFGLENSSASNLERTTGLSLESFRLVMEGLWEKIQAGLTLTDIENLLFFILFIRFIILAIRYNLKTSFYITCIGLFAGYLWYRHLIDIISMYRNMLLKLPFVNSLGIEAVQMRSINRQMSLTELKSIKNAQWYNPGQIIYYAFTKGIRHVDQDTGINYYMDPISMYISNLQEPTKTKILPIYYKLYNKIIPKIFDILSKFWTQLSGVAAYSVVTRIGKRYCPYLVRWHWTFLLMMGLVEQILIHFITRVYYFQMVVLIPKKEIMESSSLIFQINILNLMLTWIILTHIGFVIFGLFHAVCGQYFYVPFFVENTELHIGKRPIHSVYSGGNAEWQKPREKVNRIFPPKLWYGWFGRGTKSDFRFPPPLFRPIKKLIKKSFKKFRKYLKKKL